MGYPIKIIVYEDVERTGMDEYSVPTVFLKFC